MAEEPISKVAPHFDAILALIARGLTVKDALASSADFPIDGTWRSWVFDKRFPERRRRLEQARATGKSLLDASRTGSYYNDDDFDRSLAILAASDLSTRMEEIDYGDGPRDSAIRSRAKRDPEFAARFRKAMANRKHGRPAKFASEHYDEAVAIINREGVIGYKIKQEPHLPSYTTVWERAQKDLAFRRRLKSSVMEASPLWADNQLQKSLLANELYALVDENVPRRSDTEARDDIVQDIVEAVLAGEILETDIRRECANFVNAHYRRYSRRAFSLDVGALDDDGTTYLDRLTTDQACQWGM